MLVAARFVSVFVLVYDEMMVVCVEDWICVVIKAKAPFKYDDYFWRVDAYQMMVGNQFWEVQCPHDYIIKSRSLSALH